MKIFNGSKLMALAILGVLVMPLFALANGYPTVSSADVQSVTRNSAIIIAQYNSDNTPYQFGNNPEMYIRYTNLQTGMTMVSPSVDPFVQTGSVVMGINNLASGTSYSYTVNVTYNGMTTSTIPATLMTASAPVPTNNYSSGTIQNPVIAIPEIQSVANVLGQPAVAAAVKGAVTTSQTVHKNGVSLAVTDNQAYVIQNESLTYKVQYSNTHNYALTDAEIVVQLPSQYQFTGGTNSSYDAQANTVTVFLGAIPANSTNAISFDAKSIGQGNTTLTTTANLVYDGGSISATDVNHYAGGSQSILGASVFGAGFFPQTLWGWVGIIVLIAVIILVARRYMARPKPAPAKAV